MKKTKLPKGEIAKRASSLVANVAANIAATQALRILHNQKFMQKKTEAATADTAAASGATGSDSASAVAGLKDLNFKKVGADVAVSALGTTAALMSKNPLIQAAAAGVVAAALNSGINNVKDGLSGLGAVEDYVSLYDEVKGVDEPVNLTGEEAIKL